VKFGIAVGNFGSFGHNGNAQELVAVARRAELLGFDSVWLHDHLFMPAAIRSRYPYNEAGIAGFAYRQDIYDPMALMAAIAVETERVEIGTSVLIIPYRNPLLLAKMLATADQLSKGRILLGIGVGWMEEEFVQLGIGDYYPVRGRVTDEWMRICIELWTGPGASSFRGEFHRFEEVGAFPKCYRKPHIPIWVGGKGEIAARRTARYGQGYHSITSSPAELAEEVELLQRHLDKAGRDPAEVTVSMLGPSIAVAPLSHEMPATLTGSRQQIIDGLAAYAEAGLEHSELSVAGYAPANASGYLAGMQWVAEEILPALR
jgi:probable F420-dependent oxidoreductase